MILFRRSYNSILVLLALAFLSGCVGRPAPAAVSVPVANAAQPAVAAEASPASTPVPTAAPSLAPLQAATAVPTDAPSPAALPPSPTAVPPSPTALPPSATPLAATPAPTPAPVLPTAAAPPAPAISATGTPTRTFSTDPNPLQIDVMRKQSYPGSEITFEQTLAPNPKYPNYDQYIVSYKSDGYKIYALMTIPKGPKPPTGWPVIIFNHGFIPPTVYRTTERYVDYVGMIANSGYIVFKSDYRGHGNSEGPTTGGGYGSPGFTDDVLNALASVKMYKDADPNRIGMWGHSMGGSITLRAMVVSKDVKAGVIWGGVVAPYPDIFARGNRPQPLRSPGEPVPNNYRGWRQQFEAKYGTAAQNPAFWASISPNTYLADISGPVQLDHSTTDEEVPVEASQTLAQELKAAGKTVELYTYPGDNHNINGNFALAMQRTIAFFDKYVKGAQ